MPHTIYGQIGAIATVLACFFALAKGGAPERIAAAALLIAEVAVVVLQDRSHFLDPQRRILACDVALMVVFGTLMTRFPRRWLLPATGFQILSTALHFAALWTSGVRPWAYVTLIALLGYGQLAVLVGGSARVSRAKSEADQEEAEVRAAQLCRDFGPERALHWVEHARSQARGLERRRLGRLSEHVARRVWPEPYRGDGATRVMNRRD